MRAAVIIPTYNEAENIQQLISEIIMLDEDLSVFIIDDNSPDGTGEVADILAQERPTLQVQHRKTKMGLGTAHLEGFRLALQQNFQRIISMDADFSHHPRYIPQMLQMSHQYDLVIGSRYVDGGGSRYWGIPRRLLSWSANCVSRIALDLQVRDCTAGFRCYRRKVLETISLDTIFSNGYSFLVEMLYRCNRHSFRIGEIPIIYEDRRYGTSKISRQEILKAMYTVFRLGWEKQFDVPYPERLKLKGEGAPPWNT